MQRKKLILLIILIFILFTPFIKTSGASNAGFIPANIWYSKDPFVEGDKIQIYTLIFNPDTRELSGKIMFYDNTILLGQKSFKISAKSTKDIYVNWTVTPGDHTIFAKIEGAQFLNTNGKYEEASLSENTSEKSEITIAKKISQKTQVADSITKVGENIESTILNTKKTITTGMPNFITEPVSSFFEKTEDFRKESSELSKNTLKKTKDEIKNIENKPKKTTEDTYISKPLKYIWSFLLSAISFMLNSQILFYGTTLLLFFIIVKFIWSKVF